MENKEKAGLSFEGTGSSRVPGVNEETIAARTDRATQVPQEEPQRLEPDAAVEPAVTVEALTHPKKARCDHRHDDGRACANPQWREGRLCYHHDPATKELRREQIGRRQKTKAPREEDLQAVAAAAMEDLRTGKLSPGQGYAIGYLAQTLLAHERQRTPRKRKRKRSMTPQQEAREVRRRWRELHGLDGESEKDEKGKKEDGS